MAGEKRNILGDPSSRHFPRPFRIFLVPTICPWVSEDEKERGWVEKSNKGERNLGECAA